MRCWRRIEPDAVAVEQLYLQPQHHHGVLGGTGPGRLTPRGRAAQDPRGGVRAPPGEAGGDREKAAADKRQVAFMVRALLKLSEFPKPDDAPTRWPSPSAMPITTALPAGWPA